MLRGFACALAGAAMPACGCAALAAPADVALRPIADGVFAFSGVAELMNAENRGAICNLGVVIGDDAAAVIDSGGSIVHARAFLEAVRAVTAKPVRYLINTHMHPDHVFGNAAFRDIGATIVGHRNLPRALAERGDFYLRSFRREMGEALMESVEIVLPSLTVDGRLDLDLGGRVLDLRAWDPAHTDNDLTVFDALTRTLFAGDLVFLDHLPTLDGSLIGWLGQMEALAAIDAAHVVPGHGPVPSPWPAALAPQRGYFEALARDLRHAIAEGTPLAEAIETAGSGEREGWALFDEFNRRNATAAYAELEWE